jgi:hypothetical protein
MRASRPALPGAPVAAAVGTVPATGDIAGKGRAEVGCDATHRVEDGSTRRTAARRSSTEVSWKKPVAHRTALASKTAEGIIEVEGAVGGEETAVIVDGSTHRGAAASAVASGTGANGAVPAIATIAAVTCNDTIREKDTIGQRDSTEVEDGSTSRGHRRFTVATVLPGAYHDVRADAGPGQPVAAQ